MMLVVKAAVMSFPLFTRSNGIMIIMSKFIPLYNSVHVPKINREVLLNSNAYTCPIIKQYIYTTAINCPNLSYFTIYMMLTLTLRIQICGLCK